MADEEKKSFCLPQLDTCCCFPLRAGAKIIGWFYMVLGVTLLITLLFLYSISSERNNAVFESHTELMIEGLVRKTCVALSLALPITAFFLLIGVYKRIPEWLLTSLVLLIVCTVLDIYVCVILAVSDRVVESDRFSTVMHKIGVFFGVFNALFGIISILTVNSYHNVLMMTQNYSYKPQRII